MRARFLLALAALPAATLAAADKKPLSIPSVIFSQYEDGPPVPAGFDFLPGDTVFVRFFIAGYHKTEDGKISISRTVDVLDPEQVRLVPARSGKLETELAEEDKDWMPKVRQEFVVPPEAASGTYMVHAAVKDELAGTEVKSDVKFVVRGKDVAPSDALTIRNFRFLRGEEDGKPLPVAAYRPGDPVWARFEMIGYKLGAKNALDVQYGLAVLRASGEKMFEQAVAAEAKEETFYPKRFVPGILSLNLDKDIHPGEYTIAVTVRDGVGNQTFEEKYVFRVE